MKLKTDKTIPPSLAKRMLPYFLSDDVAKEVQSDLDESGEQPCSRINEQ